MAGMTKDELAKLKPKEKDYMVALARVRGIYLRIYPDGSRVWLFRSKAGKKTLGNYGQWSVGTLEVEAARLWERVRAGKPLDGDEESTLPTMDELWKTFEREYFLENDLSEAYKTSFTEIWFRYIQPKLGSKRLDEVTSGDAKEILMELLEDNKKTPYNQVRSHLSVIWKWADAAHTDVLGRNWVYGRPHQYSPEKNRAFSLEEYKAFGNAIKRSRSPYKWNVLFLCLTGSRAGIFSHWNPAWVKEFHLDFPEKTKWVKNARWVIMPGKVPSLLSKMVLPLQTEQVSHSMESLCKLAGIERLGTHIPRKSYSTWGVRPPLDIKQEIVDAIINHKAPKTQRSYFLWDPPSLLPFAEQIHQHILSLMEIEL